jgi:hypothetical protein
MADTRLIHAIYTTKTDKIERSFGAMFVCITSVLYERRTHGGVKFRQEVCDDVRMLILSASDV